MTIAIYKSTMGVDHDGMSPPERKLAIKSLIYLDYQAHAPLDDRVLSTLQKAYMACDHNPHSTHWAGERARAALEQARGVVATAINATAAEVIFVSGATEANNLAFSGLADRLRELRRTRILMSAGEHPSVFAAAEALDGFQVERIRLHADGTLDLDHLSARLADDVGIVSVAGANHEIGTLQPLKQIQSLSAGAGALLHSDLAQALGKVEIDARMLDLASVSSHKIHGPSGIGALYIRRKHRRHLRATIVGGGQEGGARAGTVAVPLCVAFAKACELADREREETAGLTGVLRDRLLERLKRAPGLQVNGSLTQRLPTNINISYDGVDGEALVMTLRDEIAFSTGSACTSASLTPSHVLTAIGCDERRARGAIRLSLARSTTVDEIDRAADAIVAAVGELRSMVRKVA